MEKPRGEIIIKEIRFNFPGEWNIKVDEDGAFTLTNLTDSEASCDIPLEWNPHWTYG